MTGKILIRNLEFQARHGATAIERKLLRRFQVDIDIDTALDTAIVSDRLADTVNYHEACRLAVEVGTTNTFHLLERLAGAILQTLAERMPGSQIMVEVRKLNPPCPGSPAYTAVRLSGP